MTGGEVVLGLVIFALLGYIAWQQREWREEREGLMQRIQDPDRAVVEYARRDRPERRPARVIPADDDAAMAQAIEERKG